LIHLKYMENTINNRFEPVNAPDPDKTISCMAAVIPGNAPEDSYTSQAVMDRLKQATLFNLKKLGYDEEKDCPIATVCYEGEIYEFQFDYNEFQMSEMFRISHHLNEENKKLLEEADMALYVDMYYGPDPLKSFHLQLKVLETIYPENIAIADYSAFTVYSPMWVKLAAESTVPPSPDYLYSVHGVRDSDENKKVKEEDVQVWFHTHGLNRCGFSELEILGSTIKTATNIIVCSTEWHAVRFQTVPW
ncbi:MAG: DUF4026 domain-containing protein, partial [Tannerellaceae bacterium]|nr:DUF4026 domain-containing protein [Tannerellaceae bacterium]